MAAGLESISVLLVDDNPNMREIVGVLLTNIGVTKLETAHEGGQALSRMRDWQPDLAIVDFRMQPVNGVEFTRQVRNSPRSRNPYMPIIMMTGHSDLRRVHQARDAGVTEFVVKPVNARILFERINSVITRPRPFVRTSDYFGPCRRRRLDLTYSGPERRIAEPAGAEATKNQATG